MSFSQGKVIFWGIFFLFLLFLSCRTLQILFSYSGSWGGFYFFGWLGVFLAVAELFQLAFSGGKALSVVQCRWKLPLPACPFIDIFTDKILWNAVNCESISMSSGSPRMEGHQGLQGQGSVGSSCWSWQQPLSCSISLPKLCLGSFPAKLSFPSLAPSRQLKFHDKGNKPPHFRL